MTLDSAQDWTFTKCHPAMHLCIPSLCSAKISKCHKTLIRFILNRDGFMEENTVLNLKSATQNLIILRSWGLSPATRVVKKKKNCCTMTFEVLKVLNVPIWHFKAFRILWTFKNWMWDCAEGVKQPNVLAFPSLAAIQQVGMRYVS